MPHTKEKIILGLSGGADSVCLFHKLIYEYNKEVIAVHINHNLRKSGSFDENFVRKLCEKHKVKLYVFSCDIEKMSKIQKTSVEVTGRNFRYEKFFEVLKLENGEKIATAHNLNDFAETIIMNFIRGTGLKGLRGIEGNDIIIRPILDMTRIEIENYCSEKGLEYCTDETNFDTKYTRNKIRQDLLPQILELNSNFLKSIKIFSEIINKENDFLESYVNNIIFDNKNDFLEINKIKREHISIQRRILKQIIENFILNLKEGSGLFYKGGTDVEFRHIDILIENFDNEHFVLELRNKIVIEIKSGRIYIYKKTPEFEYRLKLGENFIKELKINAKLIDKQPLKGVKLEKIIIRNRKKGDKVIIEGKIKKVKSLLEKVPKHLRDKILILEVNDEIAIIEGIYQNPKFMESENGGVNV